MNTLVKKLKQASFEMDPVDPDPTDSSETKLVEELFVLLNMVMDSLMIFPNWSWINKTRVPPQEWDSFVQKRKEMGEWIYAVTKPLGLSLSCLDAAFVYIDLYLTFRGVSGSLEQYKLIATASVTRQMREHGYSEDLIERLRVESRFTTEQIDAMLREDFETNQPALGASSFEFAKKCSAYSFLMFVTRRLDPERIAELASHFERLVPVTWLRLQMFSFAPFVVAIAIMKETMSRLGMIVPAEKETEMIDGMLALILETKNSTFYDLFRQRIGELKDCEAYLAFHIDHTRHLIGDTGATQ